MGISNTGNGNPNFGNRWTAKQKKRLSDNCLARRDKISTRVKNDWIGNPIRRKAASAIMREVNPGQYASSLPHTEATKIKIGLKSAAKWTPEFKKQYQKTMEDLGHRRPLSEVPAAEIYYRLASWTKGMWNLGSASEKELLTEYGIFNSCTNKTGVVRDHRYGRWVGFYNNVFPELLRHPANCEIMTRSDNCRKFHKGDQSLTLVELFILIENYSESWHEQDLCLTLIQQYRNGDRYKQEDYK